MSDERKFTEGEVTQIVGFLSADLPELHHVDAPRLIESTERAKDVIEQERKAC